MKNILFVSIVHPDFLPPIYSINSVLKKRNYKTGLICFSTNTNDDFVKSEFDDFVILINNGSFLNRFKSYHKFKGIIKQRIISCQYDIIYAFCPRSFVYSLKYKVPVIYFALEVTDYNIKVLLRSPASTYYNYLSIRKAFKAYKICVPSQERLGWFVAKTNGKVIPLLIQNVPFIDNKKFLVKHKHLIISKLIKSDARGKIRILHSGGVNNTRSVLELVQGFKLLGKNYYLIITNIREDAYSKLIKKESKGISNILLLQSISRKELLNLQKSCHIGINLMKKTKSIDSQLIAPNKVGEYLSNGLLILGMDLPYMRQFSPYNITWLIESLDADSIAFGLISLADMLDTDYKTRISKCVNDIYNMELELQPLLKKIH